MAGREAIRFLETLHVRVDRQVRDILASSLRDPTIAAQDDGDVISNEHRILNFMGPGVVVSDDPNARRTNIYIPGSPVSGAGTTSVGSAVGNGKGLYLWNGSSNDSPPSGWETAAFNHTSWTTSITSTNTSAGAPAPLSGSSWVTINNSSSLPPTAEWLFFESFTLPSGIISSATLQVQFDDYSRGVYINGTLVVPASNFTGFSTNATVSIDPSLLNAGGSNSIAIWDRNNLGFIAIDWLLTMVQSSPSTFSSTTVVLGSDVALTTANTFYDILSLSLGAGTWFVTAQVQLDPPGNVQETTKLWNGTTTYATAGQNTNKIEMGYISALIVLTTSTTVKVSVTNGSNGGTVRAATTFNPSGNTATRLTALRMA